MLEQEQAEMLEQEQAAAEETPRDANGFATTAPYNHSNGTTYNADGFDRNGDNENGTRYKNGMALDGSMEPERDANGFATSAPYNHSNGTTYNADGRDYQGYNSAGFNNSGRNNLDEYNESYDENISPS